MTKVGYIVYAISDYVTSYGLKKVDEMPDYYEKIDMVRKVTLNKIGRFTKQDIRERCPSLSLSSVEGALRKMVVSGELKREGAGKSTCIFA